MLTACESNSSTGCTGRDGLPVQNLKTFRMTDITRQQIKISHNQFHISSRSVFMIEAIRVQ